MAGGKCFPLKNNLISNKKNGKSDSFDRADNEQGMGPLVNA